MSTVLHIAASACGIALLAAIIFGFTAERDVAGYAGVLIYTSIAAVVLSGFLLRSSLVPPTAHDESMRVTLSQDETLRADRSNRERSISSGLTFFLGALCSGAVGYLLAQHLTP